MEILRALRMMRCRPGIVTDDALSATDRHTSVHDGRRSQPKRGVNMPRLSRREFLRTAGAAGGTVSISWSGTPAAAETAVTIRQDWIHGGHHAAMWVALDKGWYAEKGLNVSIVRGFGSADTAKMIGIGKEQLGQCDAGAIILAQLKGTEQKIVGSYVPTAPYCFVSPVDKGIRAPKDLEGKTVAVSAASGEYT